MRLDHITPKLFGVEERSYIQKHLALYVEIKLRKIFRAQHNSKESMNEATLMINYIKLKTCFSEFGIRLQMKLKD